MARHLNLVQSDFEQLEKIVFPRFPFCYLTFKCDEYDTHVFEVKDISQTGMQLALKNGEVMEVKAQIRYRQKHENATIYKFEKGLYVAFENKQSAITEGQFVAWYLEYELVGSGVIS